LVLCSQQCLPPPSRGAFELGRVGDGGGELEVLSSAGVRLLEVAAHHDDVVRSRHLQLEVGLVGDHHELGVARTPKDGVVRSLKVHHLKDQGLNAEVASVANVTGKSMFLGGMPSCSG
jgi:hypothetical protein